MEKLKNETSNIYKDFSLTKVDNFSERPDLLLEISELAVTSYSDCTGLLERDKNYCNEIYILRDKRSRLSAFFMVKFEIIENINSYFLGWSACLEDYKGLGLAKYLYNTFFVDCKKKEAEIDNEILCWWTTATPIAYYWFNKNIDRCEPNLNGEITNSGRKFFKTITTHKFDQIYVDKKTPFLLKEYAAKTRYSIDESQRLSVINLQLNIKAWELFPINENNGDRYLMIGYAPGMDILKNRMAF